MIQVAEVRPRSIAAELEIPAGTRLLRINGEAVRDALDLQFREAEELLEVEVELPDGQPVVYEIEKGASENLGLVPEPDKIRRCTNACPFCFVKGNPKKDKLRSGLYIKDDDYRLSFMYGHYVTLTNLREADWRRIFEQRLSPLYVSVHSTDPEVRRRMLVNPRSARIRQHLDRLRDAGIRIHTQAVVCPGINDGEVLERTMEELYGRGRDVLSFSAVPVGLTRYNADRGIRPLTAEEARRTLELVHAVRERALGERGSPWAYASDEMFLLAGREAPGREYFDDAELAANGVGAISRLRDEVRAGLEELPDLRGRRVVLVTGTSMGPVLRELSGEIERASGARLETAVTSNGLYGPQVTTAGLLAGDDHRMALQPYADFDLALFSRQALNDDDRFLDGMSLRELRRSFPGMEIWPSEHVTDALRRA